MSNVSEVALPNGTTKLKSLTKVLDQSERVKDMVEECAEELSSVNTVLKQELGDLDLLPDIDQALAKNDSVEVRVQVAAEELAVVNEALEEEVRERQMLEHQLATVSKREEAARHAAFHDALTGLPNRLLFSDRLEHGLAQAKRHGWSLAVLFVDLDDFESINDAYGHEAGDRVLEVIAQRLRENTRADDTVCRHGGNEFLYLLMEIQDERDVAVIAEKVIKVIEEPCDVQIRDLIISPIVTANVGIAIYPKDAVTAEGLIKSADKAMYRAKRMRSGYAFVRR